MTIQSCTDRRTWPEEAVDVKSDDVAPNGTILSKEITIPRGEPHETDHQARGLPLKINALCHLLSFIRVDFEIQLRRHKIILRHKKCRKCVIKWDKFCILQCQDHMFLTYAAQRDKLFQLFMTNSHREYSSLLLVSAVGRKILVSAIWKVYHETIWGKSYLESLANVWLHKF